MSAKPANGAGEWIDPDDAPELDDDFFDNAVYEIGGVRVDEAQFWEAHRAALYGPKVLTHLELDGGVLEHFQAGGPGWQDRINAVLRHAMETEMAEGGVLEQAG